MRFAIVGGLNTVIDFAIFFTLVAIGLPTITSNFISTSIALTFSFFANKSFTFKDEGKITKTQLASFLIVTTSGLWIIQPLIIEGVQSTLGHWSIKTYIAIIIGKILATIVTFVWNYLLYRKFVFKKQP